MSFKKFIPNLFNITSSNVDYKPWVTTYVNQEIKNLSSTFIKTDGSNKMNSDLNLNNNDITNLESIEGNNITLKSNMSDDNSLINKQYVDKFKNTVEGLYEKVTVPITNNEIKQIVATSQNGDYYKVENLFDNNLTTEWVIGKESVNKEAIIVVTFNEPKQFYKCVLKPRNNNQQFTHTINYTEINVSYSNNLVNIITDNQTVNKDITLYFDVTPKTDNISFTFKGIKQFGLKELELYEAKLNNVTKKYVDDKFTSRIHASFDDLDVNTIQCNYGMNGNIIKANQVEVLSAATKDNHVPNKKYVDNKFTDNINANFNNVDFNDVIANNKVVSKHIEADTIKLNYEGNNVDSVITKKYVDDKFNDTIDAKFKALECETMYANSNISTSNVYSHFVTLHQIPTDDKHAATKKYVDDKFKNNVTNASFDNLDANSTYSHGNITGKNLYSQNQPTDKNHVTTKQYVDDKFDNINLGNLQNLTTTYINSTDINIKNHLTAKAIDADYITCHNLPLINGHLTNKAYVDSLNRVGVFSIYQNTLVNEQIDLSILHNTIGIYSSKEIKFYQDGLVRFLIQLYKNDVVKNEVGFKFNYYENGVFKNFFAFELAFTENQKFVLDFIQVKSHGVLKVNSIYTTDSDVKVKCYIEMVQY